MMFIILVLIGFVIYFLMKNQGNINTTFSHEGEAEKILKQRYVNGEIDEETYIKMLKVIKD